MPTAVLLSGGVDSVVLLAQEAAHGEVQPIYVSVGLAWEPAERAAIAALLASETFRTPVAAVAPGAPRVRPLVSLSLDMRDVYGAAHWAVRGRPPAYRTPDEDVYLPGRNIVLLGKAGVYCAAAQLDRLVLGTLAHNPFPDATPNFRSSMADALSIGLARRLRIEAPYAEVSKADVIRRGEALGVSFELTLSCMSPVTRVQAEPLEPLEPSFLHCGTCSKCRERHDAFLAAGVADPTDYVDVTDLRR